MPGAFGQARCGFGYGKNLFRQDAEPRGDHHCKTSDLSSIKRPSQPDKALKRVAGDQKSEVTDGELELEPCSEFGIVASRFYVKGHQHLDLLPRLPQPAYSDGSPFGLQQVKKPGLPLRVNKRKIVVVENSIDQIRRQKLRLQKVEPATRFREVDPARCTALHEPIAQQTKEQNADCKREHDLYHDRTALATWARARITAILVSRERRS